MADVDESKDLIDCQVTKSPSFSGSPTAKAKALGHFSSAKLRRARMSYVRALYQERDKICKGFKTYGNLVK